MRIKRNLTLSTDDALVLQQINEDGQNDVITLARRLGMRNKKVTQSLNKLSQKGLIRTVEFYGQIKVRLSRQGQNLMNYIWPESMIGLAV